jgi:hypothetical protein
MRRPLLASVALTALSAPLLALAAFTSPSALLVDSGLQGKPMDLSYEMHASTPEFFASAWLKGSVEGKDPDTVKMDAQATVDVSVMGTVIRGKFSVRAVNGTAYVHLDSVTGDYQNDEVKVAANAIGKKWYAIPMTMADMRMSEAQRTLLLRNVADALFQMTRATEGKAGVYSLTLRPDAATALQQVLGQSVPSEGDALPMMSLDDATALQEILSSANFHMKVNTGKNDVPASVKVYLSAAQDGVQFALQGTSTVRAKAVTVTVPAGAVDLEKQMATWGVPMDLVPNMDHSWSDSSSSEDVWSDDGSGSSDSSSRGMSEPAACDGLTPAQKLQALRHGECGLEKVSPRSLQY